LRRRAAPCGRGARHVRCERTLTSPRRPECRSEAHRALTTSRSTSAVGGMYCTVPRLHPQPTKSIMPRLGRQRAAFTSRRYASARFSNVYECVCVCVNKQNIAVRKHASPLRELARHMGSHSVSYHPAEVTFLPQPQPIKAGTRFSDPGTTQSLVDLAAWLYNEVVYLPKDGHPSEY